MPAGIHKRKLRRIRVGTSNSAYEPQKAEDIHRVASTEGQGANAHVYRRQQCRHGISSPGDVEGLAGPELSRRQTLPATGLHIVGAGRVRLHSHTESAFLHTDQRNRRNLYCWHACVRVRASIFTRANR